MRRYPHRNGADCHPPRRWEEPPNASSIFYFQLFLNHQYQSPWKEFKYTSGPQFCSRWPKDGSLDLQALIANGTYIQEFHRTIESKEAVLRVRDHWLPHPPRYTQEPREERASKTAHLPVSLGQALNYILFQLLSEGPPFNRPASRSWLQSSPLGHWQVLAHPQLLGGTKNKDGGLNNHKALKDSKELRPGWLTRFIS